MAKVSHPGSCSRHALFGLPQSRTVLQSCLDFHDLDASEGLQMTSFCKSALNLGLSDASWLASSLAFLVGMLQN